MGEYRSCVTQAGCNTCRIGANWRSYLFVHRVVSQTTLKDDKPGNDEQVPTTQEQEWYLIFPSKTCLLQDLIVSTITLMDSPMLVSQGT